MPRKGPAPRRELVADPVYKSVLVTQLINKVMLHGKRTVAEKIVYDAMEIIQSRLEGDDMAIDTVKRAIENVKPPLEVRSRRVGGATYQVPVEVRPERRQALAIRWIISASRGRNEQTMQQRLSAELLDAANNRGTAVKKREDTHKMAEANRAFSHYRW
jgi:small subunit ribosomal protein S7